MKRTKLHVIRESKLPKFCIILLLASFCTGCMFEAQRAYGCNNVGVFGCKDKAQPPNKDEPLPRKADDQAAERETLTSNHRVKDSGEEV